MPGEAGWPAELVQEELEHSRCARLPGAAAPEVALLLGERRWQKVAGGLCRTTVRQTQVSAPTTAAPEDADRAIDLIRREWAEQIVAKQHEAALAQVGATIPVACSDAREVALPTQNELETVMGTQGVTNRALGLALEALG